MKWFKPPSPPNTRPFLNDRRSISSGGKKGRDWAIQIWRGVSSSHWNVLSRVKILSASEGKLFGQRDNSLVMSLPTVSLHSLRRWLCVSHVRLRLARATRRLPQAAATPLPVGLFKKKVLFPTRTTMVMWIVPHPSIYRSSCQGLLWGGLHPGHVASSLIQI